MSQKIAPADKNKMVFRKTDVEQINYPEKCIITYNTSIESEWESDFATDISYYNSCALSFFS